MASDDTRLVAIGPDDNIWTMIEKLNAAPRLGELRERIALAIYVFEGQSVSNIRCGQLADAVLRVILGDSEAPS